MSLPSDAPQALVQLLPLAVRAQRRALRLDQRSLAARCGLSKSTVARVEKGDTGVSIATLLRVLDAAGLGLTVIHRDGRPWTRHEGLASDLDAATDAAGRRLPGHLPASLSRQLQSWDVTRHRDQLMSAAPRWRYDRWHDQVDALVGEADAAARHPGWDPLARCAATDAARAPPRPTAGCDAHADPPQERDSEKRRLVPLTTSEARCCSPA